MIEFKDYGIGDGPYVGIDFGRQPAFFVCGNTQHAIMQAYIEFEGRNWRRIKREVNKAIARVRKPPVAF